MLISEQIDFYHLKGYLAVENVLSSDEVGELQRVTDEFVDKSRSVREHTDVYDLEPGHSAETPKVRRLKDPAEIHPRYEGVLRHDRILNIAAQLIGNAIRTNGNKLNMKYPGFGSPVEWHQDWAFYPHTNDDILAVGVAIDDMTIENGALLVIPGSHRGPIYNHHQNGRFVGAVNDPSFKLDGAVPIEVKAGGISIHHVRTLHGSAPNQSKTPRRLYLLQLCAADAWPLCNVQDWDEFNSKLLRGKPTNQPRLVSIPVRIPLPEPEHSDSIYETQSVLERKIFSGAAG